MGDLNELSNPKEKHSASEDNSSRYTNFNNFIKIKSLIDLGYIDNPSTWYNKGQAGYAFLD